MNEKETRYDEDEEITCPNCGSNNWKLFKYTQGDRYLGFRVACANGCYVDNVNIIEEGSDSFDVVKTAFELIEYDRNSNAHKIVTQKDILKILDSLIKEETSLKISKECNMISDYGRGCLGNIESVKRELKRLVD